ncbi:MAG: uracil-DNA glycosylase [Neomegalonema sp.]|nr:uracil-DNA glycosylase [Neomegalonema sp.]
MTGANRTGRPFTGDFAGDLLYDTLARYGFSTGQYQSSPNDGLQLRDAMITNAVRCVPPQNKPVAGEINACRPFLHARLAALPELRAVLALGKIAHDSTVRALGERLAAYPFQHGKSHAIKRPDGVGISLFDSYHCSRYNTNTGRLTEQMFQDVFAEIRRFLGTD